MNDFEKLLAVISRWLGGLAGVALIMMITIVVANIIIRSFYTVIFGSYEMVRYLGFFTAVLALAYTQLERGHIGVDILTCTLQKPVQATIGSIVNLLLMGLSALISWQSVMYGIKLWGTDTRSPTLQIPLYPFLFVMAVCFAAFGLIALSQFIRSLRRIRK